MNEFPMPRTADVVPTGVVILTARLPMAAAASMAIDTVARVPSAETARLLPTEIPAAGSKAMAEASKRLRPFTCNAMVLPTTLVIDAAGKIRFYHVGYKQGDEKHLRNIVAQAVKEIRK